ncbi:MAG: PadR family transcriptional regulator [Anaerolineales bacterium]|jgi:DNA-binding PadR family transcriptional regulator|nr:PadR family transcriptional regulator [Anaerolineales bacterium]
MEENLSINIPLTETTYFILLSLSPGARHGYSIMKDVRQLSNGRVFLSTGTLYSALKRLLDLGWIERSGDPQGQQDGRGRKAYHLSGLGRQILDNEILRLQNLVSAANLRVLGDRA